MHENTNKNNWDKSVSVKLFWEIYKILWNIKLIPLSYYVPSQKYTPKFQNISCSILFHGIWLRKIND